MTSETHRSVSEVIRDISAQFATQETANSSALHLFDDELEALRRAEQNIFAQIHRLEREQLQRLNGLTTERDARFEASRAAIFDALLAQNRRLCDRANEMKHRWKSVVTERVEEALNSPELQKIWSQIQQFEEQTAPSLATLATSAQEVALTHQAGRIRQLRNAVYPLMHETASEPASPLQLDLVLTLEAVSDTELGVTFVLPISGTCVTSQGEETLQDVLLYRIMEGVYLYLKRTPMQTGHIHVGAHDGLTILELDVVTESHIEQVTAAIKQCVTHHLFRTSDLREAGVVARVTVVDANFLFPSEESVVSGTDDVS